MLKLTVVVLAVALAGTASAGGWRSLRVDASSEAAFTESLAAFEKKLSRSRGYAFKAVLQEIWLRGASKASAEQRTYTASEYFRQLDGLSYDEVVRIPDPTGEAEERYRAEYYARNRYDSPQTQTAGRIYNAPTHAPTAFSGSRVLDAGQSFRAEGRLGGNHH